MTVATNPTRRRLLTATFAATALAPLREALAQTRASGGDWLEMVQGHHRLILRSIDELAFSGGALFAARDRAFRTFSFRMTAHTLAEENAIYPALAMAGLARDADRLVLDQAHAKLMRAQLEVASAAQRGQDEWYRNVGRLRDALQRHALQDEEGDLYPKLRSMLDDRQNAALADTYEREFAALAERTWATPS